MIVSTELTAEKCGPLLRRIYADLSAEVTDVCLSGEDACWLEEIEQTELSRERERELQRQLDTLNFDPGIKSRVAYLLEQHGFHKNAAPELVNELTEAVARMLIEQQRQFRHNLHHRFLPYFPTDPIISTATNLIAGSAVNQDAIGPTVAEAVASYCKARAPQWTEKTASTHRQKLRLLEEHLGSNMRLTAVSQHDLWEFAEGVRRLRRNDCLSSTGSFKSRQTEASDGRISPVTAENILARSKALFRWAQVRGFIATNPAAGVNITAPKSKKGHKSRRPFTMPELTQLFSSPIFCGCRSRTKRFEAGVTVIRDAYFWIPVLAYYTGARLGELVQLRFPDVSLLGGPPHLSINENDGGVGQPKHLKTEAAVRLVPLHPDILTLGFAEFVAHRSKCAAPNQRLFAEVPYGADGQASTVFSKRWGRAMNKIGLTDPALVFHSFRHSAEDIFRSSQVPKYIIDQLMGHSDPSAAGEYGKGVDLVTAAAIVAELNYPVRVPKLIS